MLYYYIIINSLQALRETLGNVMLYYLLIYKGMLLNQGLTMVLKTTRCASVYAHEVHEVYI